MFLSRCRRTCVILKWSQYWLCAWQVNDSLLTEIQTTLLICRSQRKKETEFFSRHARPWQVHKQLRWCVAHVIVCLPRLGQPDRLLLILLLPSITLGFELSTKWIELQPQGSSVLFPKLKVVLLPSQLLSHFDIMFKFTQSFINITSAKCLIFTDHWRIHLETLLVKYI